MTRDSSTELFEYEAMEPITEPRHSVLTWRKIYYFQKVTVIDFCKRLLDVTEIVYNFNNFVIY